MTAPALILFAHGSLDTRAEQIYLRLRHQMQLKRPHLPIHLAFSDNCPPSASQVVKTLAKRNIDEAVFVPIDLSRVQEADETMQSIVTSLNQRYETMTISLSRPLGPAADLLYCLDTQVRAALSSVHARQLDGLVLMVPRWGDLRGASIIARRARQWSSQHRLPVQIAYGDESGLDAGQAVRTLRSSGRRHVALASLSIAPDETFLTQAQLAYQAGAIAIASPLGADERLMDIIFERYSVCAFESILPVNDIHCEQKAS